MHSSLVLTSLVAATGALASISPKHLRRQNTPSISSACQKPQSEDCQTAEQSYIDSICQPGADGHGTVDLNAPCNAYTLLTARCIYGSNVTASEIFKPTYGVDFPGSSAPLSNATQQACVCSSQLFNQLSGCMACQKAHGMHEADDQSFGYLPQSNIDALSSSYCAVGPSATPTVGFADYVYSWAEATDSPALKSIEAAGNSQEVHSTFTDPIGNKTAVSLYFTPSVMGSQAIAQLASSPVTNTAGVKTSSGEIVAATGGAGSSTTGSATGSGASGSASASATGSGVGKRESAAAGAVVGLAALVALL